MLRVMATPAALSLRTVQQIHAKLNALLGEKAPRFDDVDKLVSQLRVSSEGVIFLDFNYAASENVERCLWDVTARINQKYRKSLEVFKQADQKKHHVEKRKIEKSYVDFLKTSQFFYKGLIQRLASHFAGLDELRRIAHRLSIDTLSVDQKITVPPEVGRLIDKCCHSLLLHLGDLSRYRNALRTQGRSWDPAMGYYGLANDLLPNDGSAHNQMAVIALQDVNHLDAVYHLYRALAVDTPHTLAKSNLELEFKKIIKQRTPSKNDNLSTLIWWFILLHAKFYEGIDFSTHKELENEVLSRLALLLKDQSFGDILEKFVIINTAAQYFAGQKVIEEEGSRPESIRFFHFSMSFNARIMTMLLQVLQPELAYPATGDDLPRASNGSTKKTPELITAVTRRVLPALRQYSAWLVSQTDIIIANVKSSHIAIHIGELWQIYAEVLTQMANFYPVQTLKPVDYLLEEDSTTIGFQPFRNSDTPSQSDFYIYEDGTFKPRITDAGVQRAMPDEEMRSRVRDVLVCGLVLQGNNNCPIVFSRETETFIVDQGFRHASPIGLSQERSVPAPLQTESNISTSRPSSTSVALAPTSSNADESSNFDKAMYHMVENLVGPNKSRPSLGNETSYGMHSTTANEIFAPIGSGSVQPFYPSMPKTFPTLPGKWNSAFAPQPNELQPASSNRSMTASRFSPLPLSTTQDRLAAASMLEQVAGYPGSPQSPWGKQGFEARFNSSSASQGARQQMQQPFDQVLSSSSNWSDSSSLLASTPHHPNVSAFRVGPNDSNSTSYGGGSNFEKDARIQSSIWNGSQPSGKPYTQTPPGGQGG